MFNDNASDTDRQKKLEELIRKVDDEEENEEGIEKESEVPNDFEMNQMLARGEEELKLFTQMDEEMYLREGKEEKMKKIMEMRPGLKDYSRINYRLIQDWEVPEWIKVKPVDREEEDRKNNNVDLGKRQRKTLINMDNLSE